MNSRKLDALHPIVATKAVRLITALADQGIEMIILSTLRDAEEQAARYAIGREEKGPVITSARPMGHVITDNPAGFSFHEYGLAFDAWPLVRSRVVTSYEAPDYDLVWRVIRRLSADRSINLQHGGSWKLSTTRRQWEHFHYSAGLSIEAIRAGEKLPDVQI
jgi:hypothetical protein